MVQWSWLTFSAEHHTNLDNSKARVFNIYFSVGAVGLDIFSLFLLSIVFLFFSASLWETA